MTLEKAQRKKNIKLLVRNLERMVGIGNVDLTTLHELYRDKNYLQYDGVFGDPEKSPVDAYWWEQILYMTDDGEIRHLFRHCGFTQGCFPAVDDTYLSHVPRQKHYLPIKHMVEREFLFKNPNIIALDTETTGFGPDAEVLQLSIIDEEGHKIMSEYFRPEHTTEWPQAEAVNGISPESVKDRPSIKEKAAEIQEILNKADVIVGYNLGFDLRMLKQSGIKFSEDYPKCLDIMSAYAEVKNIVKEDGSLKWHKLKDCAADLGYPAKEWHEATADAKATMYCFRKMMREGILHCKDLLPAAYLANFKATAIQKKKSKVHINILRSTENNNEMTR